MRASSEAMKFAQILGRLPGTFDDVLVEGPPRCAGEPGFDASSSVDLRDGRQHEQPATDDQAPSCGISGRRVQQPALGL
jgi:hypothetical protein